MFKLIFCISSIFVIVSCTPKHKSPQEIYNSGKVDNFEDFIRIDTMANDDDTLADVYRYKYDTSFNVSKYYTYTYSTKAKTFRNYLFFYKGKMEGRVIVHHTDGSIMFEVDYKNDTDIGRITPDGVMHKD